MKKCFSLIALTSLLFASSCSEDAIMEPANGNEATVTFSVELPNSISSRAYSDGLTANRLEYAVYVSGQTECISRGWSVFNGLKTDAYATLAPGVSYDIIFWATAKNKTYYGANPEAYMVDWEARTMTVDYSKLKANDESNDAFYAYVSALQVQGAETKHIKLYRPFAQVNLGTNDFDKAVAAGLIVERSSMVMTDVPNVLNFTDGSVSGNATVTLAENYIAPRTGDNKEDFPVDGYEYLEMNYILAGPTKSANHTCTFSIYKQGAEEAINPNIVVSNVPIQRNYRTNIYGSLLTDHVTFNLEIIPDYETPDYYNPTHGDIVIYYTNPNNWNPPYVWAWNPEGFCTEEVHPGDKMIQFPNGVWAWYQPEIRYGQVPTLLRFSYQGNDWTETQTFVNRALYGENGEIVQYDYQP